MVADAKERKGKQKSVFLNSYQVGLMGQDKPLGGAGVSEGGTRSGTDEGAASSCPPPGSAVALMSSLATKSSALLF